MNARLIIPVVIIVIIIILMVTTWKTAPHAKYIAISRSDGENKYIAIDNVDVFTTNGSKQDIVSIGGKSQTVGAFSNKNSADAATTATAGNDVFLNGTNKGYIKDTTSVSPTVTYGTGSIGPVVAFIPSAYAATGYIELSLGCSVPISCIEIKVPDDLTSKTNIQKVRIVLLDEDKNVIKGSEQIIPVSDRYMNTLHKIHFY